MIHALRLFTFALILTTSSVQAATLVCKSVSETLKAQVLSNTTFANAVSTGDGHVTTPVLHQRGAQTNLFLFNYQESEFNCDLELPAQLLAQRSSFSAALICQNWGGMTWKQVMNCSIER